MRKFILLIIIVATLTVPVSASEFTAPLVPESGQAYMPAEPESFGEGLWFVIKSALAKTQPSIVQASKVCMSVIALVLLLSLLRNLSGKAKYVAEMAAAVAIGLILIQPTSSLIGLATDTVSSLSEYGKLLIPVLTAATAAQGGVNSSNALFSSTTIFSAILSNLIGKLIVPLIYIFLCLGIANSAISEDLLKKLRDLIKWLMTWSLKIVLYVFTGFTSITGVISGSADASMVKATKIAISGSIPVIGGILSDASETILVSVGLMKSAVGVYGILAIIATWIGPFLEIGLQYLLLKVTAAACSVFGSKRIVDLVHDFAVAMGFVLAAISAISLLLLIGVVCFMKGVS